MLVRALSTITAYGEVREKGDEFRVEWTEEEGQRYEAEGIVSVIEWDARPDDVKPRKGAAAKAALDAPVDSVLYKRVERLENALSDVIRTVSELALIRLTAEEVEAIRVALGTAADAVGRVDQVDAADTSAYPECLRPWMAMPLVDVEPKLLAEKMDDLRALANDLAIPNLHGNMKKVDLVALIMEEIYKIIRSESAIVIDGQPVVPEGGTE
ncbi:MAG: hypothetical protein K1X67_08045 [Fimbriimonadaceae bacterium]|nr:hypothetical protein [Fimbriimonadaceae bacterium]